MFEIEHLKSGLAISTHMGCPLGCTYCVLDMLPNYKGCVKRLIMPPELLEKALKQSGSLFLDGNTPIIINNRTDPFLPEVIEDTLEILKRLSELQIQSPVVLVSKIIPPAGLPRFCEKLNLLFFYSYSNIQTDFNYGHLGKIDILRERIGAGRLFHYYRPVIPDVNDNLAEMNHTISRFSEAGFSGSIISGLRVTRKNSNLLFVKDSKQYERHHKLLQDELYVRIQDERKKTLYEYPVFRHTSCAIDYYMNRRNRLNYFNQSNHCYVECPNYENCSESETPDYEETMRKIMEKLNKKIQYKIISETIIIEECLNQEEVAFMKNAFGVKVICSNISPSLSEEYIANE